ncbi:hypothetical protein OPQ81_008256 [Rhizoctonia solani]|nr:hypothetical protein OPQ81_008256 [Rhizoctonia solani]
MNSSTSPRVSPRLLKQSLKGSLCLKLFEPPPPRRSGHVTQPPERYGALAEVASKANWEEALTAVMESPPQSFKEAMSRPNAPLWIAGMIEEIELFAKHEVWERAEQPKDKNVIKCRWVFSYKFGANGEIERHKARLVAKGFSQQPGVDFGEISSPVAASDSYQVLFSIVISEDLELLQLDIKMAFLHGTLDEEIYMEQPEGFSEEGDFVLRLVKALYGLKQAACAFYLRLKEVLEKIGFAHCETDHAVFH